MSDRVRLFGLIGVEGGLVLGLHHLARLDGFAVDWSDLSWLEESSFEEAFGVLVLVVALAMSYWLLMSTVSFLAASLWGRPAVLGAMQWLTLPPIRRLVNRAVALSIAASTAVSPAVPALANLTGFANSAQVVVEVDTEGRLRPPGTGEAPEDETSSGVIVPPHLQAPPVDEVGEDDVPQPDRAVRIDGTVEHTVKVQRGDHLWSLSEQHLENVLGRSSLAEHEIAPYWVRVIDLNRSRIRSGNPDLIYPGEIVLLPSVIP